AAGSGRDGLPRGCLPLDRPASGRTPPPLPLPDRDDRAAPAARTLHVRLAPPSLEASPDGAVGDRGGAALAISAGRAPLSPSPLHPAAEAYPPTPVRIGRSGAVRVGGRPPQTLRGSGCRARRPRPLVRDGSAG